MIPALLITLREGLEASLIVSILAAYLVRTGRRSELRQLQLGVVAALAASAVAGLLIALGAAELPHKGQELLEALTGVAAVGLLTWMIFWMRSHSRSLKTELAAKADQAIAAGSGVGLAVLAFASVGREGLETVLFLYAAFTASKSATASGSGAVIGLVLAVGLGYAIYRGSARLNLKRFFQVTGILIIAVAAGLLASSVHAFNEAGVLLFLTSTAWDATGLIGSGGVLGTLLKGLIGFEPKPTVLQAIAYFSYLVPTFVAYIGLPSRTPRATATQAPTIVG